ncbi:hypothetical protein [Pseudanabaena sp. FACHB-1998]|uniref:hypothetical protein n=1 Tax=Pseudanabaena sp. FACHB-1998 TaxID=2692858 RepID=UPI001F54BCA9|nr:hypothetical protein [Pseudanabaena sp. FACHB-1998]
MSSALAAIAFFVASSSAIPVKAQTPPVRGYQPKATETARNLQIQDQQQKADPRRFDLKKYPVNESNATHWQDSLWAIGVLAPDDAYAVQALEKILQMTTAPNLSDPQKGIIDMAMQVGTELYTLKPEIYGTLQQYFLRTINYSSDSQWVALSLSALAKSPQQNMPPSKIDQLSLTLKQRFPKWQQDLHLQATLQAIQSDRLAITKPSQIPSLRDLLKWQITPQQPHMYVFCRPNREVLCLSLLKDRTGKFVKQGKQLWSNSLLLQSLRNLDWYFTNGRTPQGIYRMEGISLQPDDEFFHAYGQFSLVNLFVPFEDGVNSFLPNQKGKFTGNLKAYQALLPPSWRNYAPIQQTYWAGNVGRSLFRIHGSGAAIDFFRNKSAVVSSKNFTWNATLGCLSALEIYDNRGSLVKADMPRILDALNRVGKGKVEGYLIVVDIPSDSQEAVTVAEISQYLQ